MSDQDAYDQLNVSLNSNSEMPPPPGYKHPESVVEEVPVPSENIVTSDELDEFLAETSTRPSNYEELLETSTVENLYPGVEATVELYADTPDESLGESNEDAGATTIENIESVAELSTTIDNTVSDSDIDDTDNTFSNSDDERTVRDSSSVDTDGSAAIDSDAVSYEPIGVASGHNEEGASTEEVNGSDGAIEEIDPNDVLDDDELPLYSPEVETPVVNHDIEESITEEYISHEPIEKAPLEGVSLQSKLSNYSTRNVVRRMTSSHNNVISKWEARVSMSIIAGEDSYSIDGFIDIPALVLRKRNDAAIWDEGGGNRADGHVVLVTDAVGNPMCPINCRTGSDITNGKHSLIAVNYGDNIILGVKRNNITAIAVYKVDSINPVITSDQQTTDIKCKLVSIIFDKPDYVGVYYPDSTQDVVTGDDIAELPDEWSWISTSHPAIKAARAAMSEHDAIIPFYVKAFTMRKVLPRDVNDLSNKQNNMAHKVYNYTDDKFIDFANEVYKSGNSNFKTIIYTLIILNSENELAVRYYGVKYDNHDLRIAELISTYDGPKLHPGDGYKYLDTPEVRVTYEDIHKFISAKGPHIVASMMHSLVRDSFIPDSVENTI